MDQKSEFPIFPMHFRGLLLLAGMYTVAWSAFFKWFGSELMRWLSLGFAPAWDAPTLAYGWIGILVGLLLFVAAFYPVSWIRLILLGGLGKILLATWFTLQFIPEIGWNKRVAFHLIFNELLWLIPLVFIFIRAKVVKTYLQKDSSSLHPAP